MSIQVSESLDGNAFNNSPHLAGEPSAKQEMILIRLRSAADRPRIKENWDLGHDEVSKSWVFA
jgi:hypothetical protein